MKILVDVGNSRIGLAIMDNDVITDTLFIHTEKNKTSDELVRTYSDLLDEKLLKRSSIDGVYVSSVVPNINHALEEALKKLFHAPILFVGPGIKTGLSLKVDNPSEIGADLICDLVASKAKYGYPLAIIDLGTATKILFIDKQGSFSGAIIAPGLKLSARSLFDSASLLPSVDLKMPKKVVGKNTIDCMTSGIVYGHYSMIKGLLDKAEKEYGYTFKKIYTGGNSYPFHGIFQESGIIFDENLVFEGLKIIAFKNEGGK